MATKPFKLLHNLHRFINSSAALHRRNRFPNSIRPFHSTGRLEGRSFFLDVAEANRIREEASQTPFPVRYLEFIACADLYSFLNAMGEYDKPMTGVRFNAAYVDTHPDAGVRLPVVVCLHGTPGGHWDFNEIMTHFAAKNVRVIAINFPGYNWTKMDSEYKFGNSPEEKATFVKDFLNALGISKVQMGVVHSGGIFPGLVLSSESLNVFSSLALINPAGMKPSKLISPMFYFRIHIRYYRRRFFRPILMTIMKLGLIANNYGNQDPMQMSVAVESLLTVPYEEYRDYPTTMSFRRYPSLLINSKNDKVVPLDHSQELVDLLSGGNFALSNYDENGTLVSATSPNDSFMRHHLFWSGGHFLMKRYPDQINRILEEFLGEVLNKRKS